MADKKKGFIPLYRSIQDHWLWKLDKPFDERSAWIDLLLKVNHKEEKIRVAGRIQVIKPGQRWLSYQQLSREWGWSYKRVLRYINLLKSDGMIYADGTPNGTLVTIVNWGNFALQGKAFDTTFDTTDDIPCDRPYATTAATQTIMNKNDKEHKNIKKERFPSLDEIEPPTGGGQWQ